MKATILRVFIASPGDVTEEREILEQVIQEINRVWGRSIPIRLELISWDTHTHPDLSTDPQAVINEQIEDGYEIFIGILWTKLGTPTGRAPSGTIEEFQRAYYRHKSDPKSVKVMFYFKTTAISPSEINPSQIAQIQEFKDSLATKALYSEFSTIEEFESFSRQHLSMLVQEWGTKWGTGEKQVAEESVEQPPDEDLSATIIEYIEEDEEEGFLDLIEGGIDDLNKSSRISDIIVEATEELGNRINLRTEELQKVRESGEVNVAQTKRIANQSASDLMQFVERIRHEIPLFSESLFRALDRYGKAIVLLTDFESDNTDQVNDAISSVIDLRTAIEEAMVGIGAMRDSIKSIPRLTSKYNRAKREAVSALDQLMYEYNRGINISREVEDTMNDVLSKMEDSKNQLDNKDDNEHNSDDDGDNDGFLVTRV